MNSEPFKGFLQVGFVISMPTVNFLPCMDLLQPHRGHARLTWTLENLLSLTAYGDCINTQAQFQSTLSRVNNVYLLF